MNQIKKVYFHNICKIVQNTVKHINALLCVQIISTMLQIKYKSHYKCNTNFLPHLTTLEVIWPLLLLHLLSIVTSLVNGEFAGWLFCGYGLRKSTGKFGEYYMKTLKLKLTISVQRQITDNKNTPL